METPTRRVTPSEATVALIDAGRTSDDPAVVLLWETVAESMTTYGTVISINNRVLAESAVEDWRALVLGAQFELDEASAAVTAALAALKVALA